MAAVGAAARRVERLGVLDVMVTGDVDVQAEDFQEHCRWIAA